MPASSTLPDRGLAADPFQPFDGLIHNCRQRHPVLIDTSLSWVQPARRLRSAAARLET
jgi:hypothetical protein